MYSLKLIQAFLKVNIQQSLAYRTDTLSQIILSLLWLGWELVSLQIIFNNTSSLSGWGMGELIALLGVMRVVNLLFASVIWPNTERFNASIRDGSFDYSLLQPVNSQFLVTFSRIVIWRGWELLMGIALIVIGIGMSGSIVTPLNVISFLALCTSGVLILYSLWIVMIAFTFWFTKFDNNVTLLHSLMDTGRYPVMIYPNWLRIIVTFIVPIALATTIPVQALRGDLLAWQVALYLGIGAAALFLSSRVWMAGVRRYSSASS